MFVALLLTISTLAASLYRNANADRAPPILGYEWASHPDALLIVYPLADACSSCNFPVSGWAKRGLEYHLDVLVIASHETSELKQVRAEIASSRLTVFTGIDESLVKQFSTRDLIGGVRIRNGRILARQLGGTPPTTFFQPTEKEGIDDRQS